MKDENKKKLRTIDIAYIGLSVALIAVCSWISIPLSVPITLQTLGVCLVAGLFGLKRGTVATVAYILLGTIGVPVFAGFSSGIGIITGPTGGYIVGFIFTALIVGFVSDKQSGKLAGIVIAMIVGILVCYAFGTAWFAYVFANKGEPMTLYSILLVCVFPFIPFDAAKIVIAAILTNKLRKFVK